MPTPIMLLCAFKPRINAAQKRKPRDWPAFDNARGRAQKRTWIKAPPTAPLFATTCSRYISRLVVVQSIPTRCQSSTMHIREAQNTALRAACTGVKTQLASARGSMHLPLGWKQNGGQETVLGTTAWA